MKAKQMRELNRLHLRAAHVLQALIRIDECLAVHGEEWFKGAGPEDRVDALNALGAVDDLAYVTLTRLQLADSTTGGAR